MIDGSWRDRDFSGYDIIFHVAGIAHADVGKVKKEIKAKYYAVNTDLAIETAKKAKEDGVNSLLLCLFQLLKSIRHRIVALNTAIRRTKR